MSTRGLVSWLLLTLACAHEPLAPIARVPEPSGVPQSSAPLAVPTAEPVTESPPIAEPAPIAEPIPPASAETTPSDADAGSPTTLASLTSAADVRGRHVERFDWYRQPNAVLRARLETLRQDTERRFMARVRREAPSEPAGNCVGSVVTGAFATITCSTEEFALLYGRDSTLLGGFVRAYEFSIAGDEVEPTTVEAEFVDRAALDGAVASALDDACSQVRARAGQSDDYERLLPCPDAWRRETVGLGADGITIEWTVHDDVPLAFGGALPYVAEVPYADLLDRIRVGGVIARALGVGLPAEGPAPTTTAASRTPPRHGPWVVTTAVPMAEAAARWAALPTDVRDGVVGYSAAPGLMFLGVEDASGRARARAAATALHGTLGPTPAGASLRSLALMHTATSLNLRAEATSASSLVATMPRGTVVATVSDPTTSATSWVFTCAAEGVAGMASGRLLDPEGCMPTIPEAALSGVRDEVRAATVRVVMRIRASAVVGGRSVPAVLFIVPSGFRTALSLFQLDADRCAVGEPIGSWTTAGVVQDALVTRTTESGGETLVLVLIGPATEVWVDDGRPHVPQMTWAALRVGTSSPVWQRSGSAPPSTANELRAPALRGPSGPGFWPLAIRRPGQPTVTLHWDGTTLVEDHP